MARKGFTNYKLPLILVLAVFLAAAAWMMLRTESQPRPVVTLPGQSDRTQGGDWLQATLRESWQFYKDRFMVGGERVESNNYKGTITEGQSYAMLKSVWMDDRATFDRAWRWTYAHMKRPGDNLFGWRWGDLGNGRTGLMEFDNATDGDEDIAYALLLAGEKWENPAYTKAGIAIVKDLWRINVINLDGHYYLSPGTWSAFREEYITWDPSYFAPYVYRKFAQYNVENASGWLQLVDDGYELLEGCANLTANKLPPNWCAIPWQGSRKDGRLQVRFSDKQGDGARDFSYDAFRVFWRMGMDAKLAPTGEQTRAMAFLRKHQALQYYWRQHQTLPEGFTSTGASRGNAPSGFALSAALAQSHALNPAADKTLYAQMLGRYYHPEGYWFNDYNDYLHSVVWLHLYTLSL